MPSTLSSHQAWSTDDELSYIERIGEHSIHTRCIPRAELLKNYLHAMRQRKKWDQLNKQKVMKAIFREMMAAHSESALQ